jgi:hypothetical protein
MKIKLAVCSIVCFVATVAAAQQANHSDESKPAAASAAQDRSVYSGMYTFLKEGEFVQVTVEDDGRVNGFISRFGDGESDKGEFLDQFFKTGTLQSQKLTFTTELVHGVRYEFKGSVERGDGKQPGDDGYFVLKGTLTESVSDVNKKLTSHTRDVVFKMFPQDASPGSSARK